tara:strand:- start:76 stop:384 length:309 start_codon:yes stop_codon:yes gene_type:complete
MGVKHYSVGDTIGGGLLGSCEAVVTKIEPRSPTRESVHYRVTFSLYHSEYSWESVGYEGKFTNVDEQDPGYYYFDEDYPDVLVSPHLDSLIAEAKGGERHNL